MNGFDIRTIREALEGLHEAISQKMGKKWMYKGKTGVWRTAKSGDRVFVPDDGSGLMAIRDPKVREPAKPRKGRK
jgi:hypothetical protein